MPRRKPVSDEQTIPPTIVMLPAIRSGTHKREHDIDPYTPPPGGSVPMESKLKIGKDKTTIKVQPLKLTPAQLEARERARQELKMRAERYTRYLDALMEFGGDQEQALADVYGLPIEEVRFRRVELQADVRSGLGSIELVDVLERNDLSLMARTSLLRKHAYSGNPAASLKAIDMIGEMEGTRGDVGSFEEYLRIAKQQIAMRK